jgi:hypothetical protein
VNIGKPKKKKKSVRGRRNSFSFRHGKGGNSAGRRWLAFFPSWAQQMAVAQLQFQLILQREREKETSIPKLIDLRGESWSSVGGDLVLVTFDVTRQSIGRNSGADPSTLKFYICALKRYA